MKTANSLYHVEIVVCPDLFIYFFGGAANKCGQKIFV
jgi:hypothetical protein